MATIAKRQLAVWGLSAALLMLAACTPPPSEPDAPTDGSVEVNPDAVAKIGFDLDLLDEDGLYGPPTGKRSLDYEYCIPREPLTYADEVQAIDHSSVIYLDSAGRIGCTSEEALVIGNTQQENSRLVLLELANLDYIDRIEPVDWE